MKVPAVWKEDKELGIAYFCSNCHRFVCSSGRCDCGAEVDLNLPKEHYNGKVIRERKMTNAEKIRNMKDEELAMLLMCPAEYDLKFSKTSECNGEMDRNCYKCTLRWLRKQED